MCWSPSTYNSFPPGVSGYNNLYADRSYYIISPVVFDKNSRMFYSVKRVTILANYYVYVKFTCNICTFVTDEYNAVGNVLCYILWLRIF